MADRPCMRRVLVLLLTTALIAAACSGGSGDDADDAPTTTTTEAASPNDDQVLTGDTGEDADAGTDVVNGVWVPSSLGLTGFVQLALDEGGVDLPVIEGSATYDEIEAAANAALSEGNAVLVPSTIGARLAEAGARMTHRYFESDDPEEAATQMGVWLMVAGTQNASTRDGGDAVAENARAAASDLAQTSTASAEVDVVGETVEILGDEVDAYVDSKIQTATINAGREVVRGGISRWGTSAGARAVAKAAGPVAAVLDFLITMKQFTDAAVEAIDAESNARISAYDTGMTAVGMLSDAHTRLCQLEAPIIAGDVTEAEANDLIERMAAGGRRALGVANASAMDLEELGNDEGAAQIRQLAEARDATLQAKLLEMTRLVRDELTGGTELVSEDAIVSVIQPLLDRQAADEQIASQLDSIFGDNGGTPPSQGNMGMHSNGILMTPAAGETDILRHGQFWWAPQAGGPGLDTLLPCGVGTGRTVLCGEKPVNGGVFTVVILETDGMVPLGPTERMYQYGVVFDVDGDPSNNYRAGVSFPYDTFDNTDFWYVINGGPNGLTFDATDARTFASIPTGGRVLLQDYTISVFIPHAEIGGGPTDPAVPYRTTSFWHLGDFGINPPNEFNIDASPPFGEPLALPRDNVLFSGPPANGAPLFDPTGLDMTHGSILSGLSMFSSEPTSPDDPSVLDEHDECWASRWFFDDPTELGHRRAALSYDGALIDIRTTQHDSVSAARGSAGFRHIGENARCRDALLRSAANSNDLMTTQYLANDYGDIIVTDIALDGGTLQATSGAFFHGDMTIRFSVIGIGDTSHVTDMVFDVVDSFFLQMP